MSELLIQNQANLDVKGPVSACCLSDMAGCGEWPDATSRTCPACRFSWIRRGANVTQLKCFVVEDGGEFVWAISDNPEQARKISREYMRGDATPKELGLEPDDIEESITELPMEAELTLTSEDGPAPAIRTLTAAEWIAEQGEGFLATTCF